MQGILATTTHLTRGAREYVRQYEFELGAMEYDDIHRWVSEYQSSRWLQPLIALCASRALRGDSDVGVCDA